MPPYDPVEVDFEPARISDPGDGGNLKETPIQPTIRAVPNVPNSLHPPPPDSDATFSGRQPTAETE